MRIVYIPLNGNLEEMDVSREDMYKTLKRLLNDAHFTTASVASPKFRGHVMYVDDEGLLKNLPFNLTATILYGAHSPIVGPAVLVGPADGEGYETAVSDNMLENWLKESGFRKEHPAPSQGGRVGY